MAAKGKGKASSVSSRMRAKKMRAKKNVDSMEKKEFYKMILPSYIGVREAGVTLIDKSQGTYFAPDAIKGRTFEVNQGDMNTGANAQSYRKFKFVIDGVRGKEAYSSFYGMELTSDKIKGIPKKWHTLIEAEKKIETADGHVLRVFVVANTKRKAKSTKKNCYAGLAQVKAIRQIIFRIIEEELKGCSIEEVVKKLMSEAIGTRVEQEGVKIYPLQSCHVKKVKVLKRPSTDDMQFDTKQKSKRVDVVNQPLAETA